MNSLSVFNASILAFAITVAFMIALRPLAKSIGLVDRPGGRKLHVGEIPIIGGLSMYLGALAGLSVLGVFSGMTLSLGFSFFLLLVVGAIDDRYSVPAAVRILVQVSAVLIMVLGSKMSLQSIGNPFGTGEILLGPFSLVATVIVAVTVVNAYNLVDGVDGLAGVLTIIALLAVSVVGGLSSAASAISMIVISSIAGFLIFNFPVIANRRFRSFMGDAGSTLLGFIVFWTTLGVTQGDQPLISPVAGLWFASIPIYDSLTCFVRRSFAGVSPLKPGRDHFHHTLKRGGFGVQEILAILAGLQLLYVVIAFLATFANVPDVVLFALWSVLGVCQRWIIRTISKWHRLRVFRRLRAGELDAYRAARARSLR